MSRRSRQKSAATTLLLAASLVCAGGGSAIAAQTGGWDAPRSRHEARDILSDRRFRGIDPPRPLEGVFRRIASWRRSIADLLRDIAAPLPGGEQTLVVIVGIGLAVVAARLVARGAHGRQRVGAGAAPGVHGAGAEDPAVLEHRADEAGRRGDFDSAVRLLFRAGLLRLDRARAIDFSPSMTTGDVGRRLASRVFDELAATFEAIAYGHRTAGATDLARARDGWERLLSRSGAR